MKSLTDRADQGDGVANLQGGEVSLDEDGLFLAFAAAAELARAATATGRGLQDAD